MIEDLAFDLEGKVNAKLVREYKLIKYKSPLIKAKCENEKTEPVIDTGLKVDC